MSNLSGSSATMVAISVGASVFNVESTTVTGPEDLITGGEP